MIGGSHVARPAPKAAHKPKSRDRAVKGAEHGSITSAAQAKNKEDQYLTRKSHCPVGWNNEGVPFKAKGNLSVGGVGGSGGNVSSGVKDGGKVAWGTTSFAEVVMGANLR